MPWLILNYGYFDVLEAVMEHLLLLEHEVLREAWVWGHPQGSVFTQQSISVYYMPISAIPMNSIHGKLSPFKNNIPVSKDRQ